MKTKIKKDLRTKTLNELKTLLKQSGDDLFVLQMEKARNKLTNTKALFTKRKDIAILATILKEKELINEEI